MYTALTSLRFRLRSKTLKEILGVFHQTAIMTAISILTSAVTVAIEMLSFSDPTVLKNLKENIQLLLTDFIQENKTPQRFHLMLISSVQRTSISQLNHNCSHNCTDNGSYYCTHNRTHNCSDNGSNHSPHNCSDNGSHHRTYNSSDHRTDF